MASVESQYEAVRHLDVGESKPRPIKVPVRHIRGVSGVWLLLAVLFAIFTVTFGYIALKNAKMLECDSYSVDVYGQRVCQIKVEE